MIKSGDWKFAKFIFTSVISMMVFVGCTSLQEDPNKPEAPPTITKQMSLDSAIDAAIVFGDSTLDQVDKRITSGKEWPQAKKILVNRLNRTHESAPARELVNLLQLYQSSTDRLDEAVFWIMVDSDRDICRRLGWQLAANISSPQTAKFVEEKLTRMLKRSDWKEHLTEQLADAVSENNLVESYTLMREGLFETGDDSFARAMIRLQPEMASNDFMNYLALAPVEELRQLNQKSVNLFSCLVILRHFLNYAVSPNHAHYDHLFLYAVSRNRALNELANQVLETNFSEHRQHMAFVLVRLPTWIQIAYVENARRNQTPKTNLFLSELRRVSVDENVLSEIDEVLR